MEDEIRFLYYTKIQELADAEGWKVVWPDPETETVDADGAYQNQDVSNETFFIRPTIKSITPDLKGIRGWSKYVWKVQISIYVKEGESDLVAARVVDSIRESFLFGGEIDGENHKYKQITQCDLRPSIPMGGWNSNPALFKVLAIG